MKIKAQIDRMVNAGSIKAIASVSLDGQFVVKNLRVIDGNKGLFVAGPQESYTAKDGTRKYTDLFFPVTNAGKADLEKAVLDAYRQQLNQTQGQTQGYQGQPQDLLHDFEPLSGDDGMLPFSM